SRPSRSRHWKVVAQAPGPPRPGRLCDPIAGGRPGRQPPAGPPPRPERLEPACAWPAIACSAACGALAAPSPPEPRSHPAHSRSTKADGTYSIKVRPRRNTLYRTRSATPPALSRAVPIVVDELTDAHINNLALGRIRVIVTSRHDPALNWSHKRVYWFLAEGA